MEFPKQYKHKEREAYWQQTWEDKGIYRWDETMDRDDNFVIDTPPPTVSGLLHMGHIFSYTHTDYIARYQRMNGKNVFYPMGFDDNGLPTERLVEKTKKIRAKDVSRETFIALCEEVSAEARSAFRSLFQQTALSVDWQQEYHTISERIRRISQQSFLDLHEKGQIHRTMQPMLWDPVDQTAIAQAEVEDKEMPGHFHDIRFDVAGSDEHFIIGTTRPEMLPGCVGIFYHPDDVRYQHLAGKQAVVPLFGHHVPILSDETVEPDKGTGIMMCCTFGDEADIEKWRTHDLPLRIVLNLYGKIDLSAYQDEIADQTVIEALQGKKVTAARDIIRGLLEERGLLVKLEAITHAIKCAERSGAPLELLPTAQWFVKILEHKDALLRKSKECEWNPEWMQKRMEQWINGLNWDWCISRQRYYGVPFPAWYSKRAGEEGKLLLAEPDQLPVNPLVDLPKGYARDEVEADTDVMDTWATSALSPQLNAHGVAEDMAEDGSRFAHLYPADLRPQAHEIIRTWGFYTLLKSYLHNDSIPWHHLMVSGWCLAADKTKMSKSKGNVITPTHLLEEKGTDAVRYWASTAKLGNDTAFSDDTVKVGKKLVTKLWNASKFAALQLAHMDGTTENAKAAIEDGTITHALDRWMIGRIHYAITEADQCFALYDYSGARAAVEDVFWNDFCDNYLELVKSRAYGNAGDAAQQSACHTIWHCLNALLKLFAPIIPHITEELFSIIYAAEYEARGSIHARGSFPDAQHYPLSEGDAQTGELVVAALELVRKAKSDKNVSIKYPIERAALALTENRTIAADALVDLRSAATIHALDLVADIRSEEDETSVTLSDEPPTITISLQFAEQADDVA